MYPANPTPEALHIAGQATARTVDGHTRALREHHERLVKVEASDREQTQMLTEIRASVRVLVWLVPIVLAVASVVVGALALQK